MGAPLISSTDKIPTRKAFGEALLKLGAKHKNIVVLDADLSTSVQSHLFAREFPDRHFNMGIAEQNMIGAAAGFAIRGKIPFACSFSIFAVGRAFEQCRNTLGYGNMNVKVIGSHGGIMTGEDGATHQALEDLGCMRMVPTMKVFCPADATETKKLMEAVVNDYGPTYIRVGRAGVPVLYGDDYEFQIGKGSVLGDGTDICIFAIGSEVSMAVKAAELLAKDGVQACVANMCSLKPIDRSLIVTMAKKCKMLVSAEDHHVEGGLGSAIAEVLTDEYPKKLLRLGMQTFGESGKWEDLYKKYKLDGPGLYEQIMEKWREKWYSESR